MAGCGGGGWYVSSWGWTEAGLRVWACRYGSDERALFFREEDPSLSACDVLIRAMNAYPLPPLPDEVVDEPRPT